MFYSKYHFNVANIFALKLFKRAENQFNAPEQRFVIIFWLTKTYKPSEIYRILCDVYGKAH